MLSILLLILICNALCGDTHNITNQIKEARELVFNFLNDTRNELLPGLVIGVSVSGEQKWIEGFGSANIANNIAMTDESVMEIGSISKSFTAGLALILVQQGKLEFDVPISSYLTYEEFPNKTWNGSAVNITLRQLLHMTAGIPNGPSTPLEVGKCLRCVNQKDRLVLMRDKELEFNPGTKFTYTNRGYELVGAIIESVLDNITFDEALTGMIRNVFALNETSIIDSQRITSNLASFYTTEWITGMDNMESQENTLYNSGMWGNIALNDYHAAAAITATMSDMLNYGQTWLDAYHGRSERFLKQSMVKEAWTPCDVCLPYPYGMGWVIEKMNTDRPSGDLLVWHNGGTVGCRSVLAIYPETDVVVAASANFIDSLVDEFVLNGQIADLFAVSKNITKSHLSKIDARKRVNNRQDMNSKCILQ